MVSGAAPVAASPAPVATATVSYTGGTIPRRQMPSADPKNVKSAWKRGEHCPPRKVTN